MSNGNQSHTKVTQVEIGNDNTILVSVEVDAFMPGESVEISGYVAQNHGAFATFNGIETITTKLSEPANLTLSATVAPNSAQFQKGHDVTVFSRAAKVWITVLAEGQAQLLGAQLNVAGPGTVWGKFKGAAGPEKYSYVQEGNQSGSSTGDASRESSDGSST